MKRMIATVFSLVMLLSAGPASAEILVVASKGTSLANVTLEDIRQLFSGKKRSVDGVEVTPLDMPANSPIREQFYQQVLNKSPAQMRSHWARLTFTGKGNPPRAVTGTGELKALLVPANSGYIGYMERSEVSADMTVLFALN